MITGRPAAADTGHKNRQESAMVQITVGGQIRTYEEGTLLKQVAEDMQDQYDCDILLATVNGKLRTARRWDL